LLELQLWCRVQGVEQGGRHFAAPSEPKGCVHADVRTQAAHEAAMAEAQQQAEEQQKALEQHKASIEEHSRDMEQKQEEIRQLCASLEEIRAALGELLPAEPMQLFICSPGVFACGLVAKHSH
jgi:hypothetical protein